MATIHTTILLFFTCPCTVSGLGRSATNPTIILHEPIGNAGGPETDGMTFFQRDIKNKHSKPKSKPMAFFVNKQDNNICKDIRPLLTNYTATQMSVAESIESPPVNLTPTTWVQDLNRYTYGDLARDSDGRVAPSDSFVRPFHDLGINITEFNAAHNWVTLNFSSRNALNDTKEDLEAIYLECPRITCPTVIVVHDNKKNSRDYTVQSVAGMVRMMNFNVFIIELRTAREGKKWEWQVMYDILGAWDFVNSGIGQQQDQIALLGFSMGAYVSEMAFGFDPRIKALLVSSGVMDLPGVIVHDATDHDPIINSNPSFKQCMKAEVEDILSTNFSYDRNQTPQVLIKKNDNKRYIGIHHFQDDTVVPFTQVGSFEKQMKRLHYKVQTWYPTAHLPDAHCNIYLWRPYQSAKRLCNFFTKAFDKKESWCELELMEKRCNKTKAAKSGTAMQWKPSRQILVVISLLAVMHML